MNGTLGCTHVSHASHWLLSRIFFILIMELHCTLRGSVGSRITDTPAQYERRPSGLLPYKVGEWKFQTRQESNDCIEGIPNFLSTVGTSTCALAGEKLLAGFGRAWKRRQCRNSTLPTAGKLPCSSNVLHFTPIWSHLVGSLHSLDNRVVIFNVRGPQGAS